MQPLMINLLNLNEQSYKGLHCLPFSLHLLDLLLYGKTTRASVKGSLGVIYSQKSPLNFQI